MQIKNWGCNLGDVVPILPTKYTWNYVLGLDNIHKTVLLKQDCCSTTPEIKMSNGEMSVGEFFLGGGKWRSIPEIETWK